VLVSLVWEENVEVNVNLWKVLHGLQLHYSQFFLYRILFLILSSFTYVNSFIKM